MFSLEQAAEIAPKYGIRGCRHVACAVVGKSRWFGVNSYKTHPVSQRVSPGGETFSSLHAEQAAILRVPLQIRSRVTLYVARLTLSGRFACSQPCEMCADFLKMTGIETVYFTDWSGNWVRFRESSKEII